MSVFGAYAARMVPTVVPSERHSWAEDVKKIWLCAARSQDDETMPALTSTVPPWVPSVCHRSDSPANTSPPAGLGVNSHEVPAFASVIVPAGVPSVTQGSAPPKTILPGKVPGFSHEPAMFWLGTATSGARGSVPIAVPSLTQGPGELADGRMAEK